MEHKLFHVLLIVNAVCMAIGNPIASTSYRFEVYPVDKCPMNKSEFEEAAIRKNCSRDTRYLCAPDRSLSSLIEFCTDVRKSLFGPDNCVRLEGTGNLNHYNCEEFSSDCPSAHYFDDEIYRYPACLSINRDLNCFVADTNCTERLCNTTALERCLNNSRSEDSTSKMEINTSETHSNINKIIIPVVCVFVIIVTIVIGILGLFFYKRLRKNSGKTKKQIHEDNKLKDFLSKGKVTVRHVRCVIVGCGGAGKTTLLRRLQNGKFKDLKNTDMTELVDVHVKIFDVLENENTIQSVHNENQLPSITFPPNLFEENDTTPQLAETPFRAEQLTEENDQSEYRDIEISEHESLIDNFESMDESENEETEWPQLFNGAEEQVELVQLASRNATLNTEENPNQILEENETNNYTNPVLDDSAKYAFLKITDAVKELSSYNHFCFLDFAGQSMYYAFQQIFFSPKTCYILVVDMTKEFNKQVSETDEKCCSLFESWTYKDYYQFWLKLIDSCSDLDSPVILVGTHAENLSKQDSEKFFRKFHALFKDHPDIPRHLSKARNFAIGFPEKGSKLADLKEIKSCIANIVNLRGYSDQIQPVWALFEQIMQEEKRRRIIPRKILSDYNKALSEEYRLNDENITQMLLFLHRVGNILYFDEGILKETIILDVQWFLDAFKSIIAYPVGIETNDQKRYRFKDTGEISDQELTAIWESCIGGQTLISLKKVVLSYMEHFGWLAICDEKNEKLFTYYIPSMNRRRFINPDNSITKSPILCFQFNEKKQLPFNIFYRLIVKCLKINEWSILQEENQKCWYENVACFSYRHIVIVMCLCKFQIQLQVWSPDNNGVINPELLFEIQRSVEEKLSEEKDTYKIGYKCKKGMLNVEEDNSFIAQSEFPVSELICSKCILREKHYVDNQICWVQPKPFECSELQRTLYTACQYGEDKTVQNCLLRSETEINVCSNIGKTPLHIACQYGKESTVQLLLNNKADINLRSESGVSPLYEASQYGRKSIVQLLLSNNANINLSDESGTSPLHIACQQGHDSVVQVLLNSSVEINLCNESGASPLHIACQQGHLSIVQHLLRNGADINLRSKNGPSPLYIACQKGHGSIVQLLLNNGADTNLCSERETSPLSVACQKGHGRIVQFLLSNSANVNLCNESGTSPLHIACQQGDDSVVKVLLKNSADINLCNESGASPIHIACQYGHASIVQLLLSNGVDINLCSESGSSPLYSACQCGHYSIVEFLLRNGADISLRSKTGSSPLCIACKNGYDAIVQLLLSNGAKIDLCSESEQSPLYIACQYGHPSIVQLLLSNGAGKSLSSKTRFSLLYIACKNGYDAIVQLLLDEGAKIDLCNESGASLLYIACMQGHDKIVQLLLSNSAVINFINESGTSPLYIACKQGHYSIVQILLGKGAYINLCSKSEPSPLYIACKSGHERIVQLLLNNGANTNLCDESGTSPLHIACQQGHDNIVQLLLSNSADINLRSVIGGTPLHIACKYGHDNIAQLLLNNGANINLFSKS